MLNILNMSSLPYITSKVTQPISFYSTNRESCAMSTKRTKGYLAFAYDPDTQQCERGPATCLRPAEGETTKKVYMSSVTSAPKCLFRMFFMCFQVIEIVRHACAWEGCVGGPVFDSYTDS